MRNQIIAFFHDCRGVTSIEYGLIIMAITLSLLVAYFLAGDALREMVGHTASALVTISSDIASDLNEIE